MSNKPTLIDALQEMYNNRESDEVFAVINEFECRKVERFIFTSDCYGIDITDIAEFEENGYKVVYLGFDTTRKHSVVDKFYIERIM